MNAKQVSPSLFSIGRCCQLTQTTPNELRTVAAEMSIRPAVEIDGVPHFCKSDLRRFQQHLKREDSHE